MNRIVAFAAAAALAAGIGLTTGAQKAEAQQRFLTIGTGGVTGVYYPTGGAICRLVNAGQAQHNIRCSVEATDGSVFNLNSIRRGELDMGVAQSDWQHHAYQGSDRFQAEGPFQELRAVFGLHNEPFTVVARADANINTFEDLRGKRVNIGSPGSGQRATMDVVMQAYGWTTADFSLASELAPAEQAQALCDNRVDAIIYTVGHPNGSIQEATTSCPSRLIPVSGERIQQLLDERPYYTTATIPGGMYTGNPDDIETFGVRATLVTSTRTEADVVYEAVKAVFDRFDNFKRLHPAFQTLEKEDMVEAGLTAPLHEGAERYFKEAGLM